MPVSTEIVSNLSGRLLPGYCYLKRNVKKGVIIRHIRDVLTLAVLILLTSLSIGVAEGAEVMEVVTHPEGWTVVSHGRTAKPDYDLVFPQNLVNRLDIVFDLDEWQIMMDDLIYREKYLENLEIVLETAFDPEVMTVRYRYFHDMISPFVIGESGELDGYTLPGCIDEFDAALEELVDHVSRRNLEVKAFLRL